MSSVGAQQEADCQIQAGTNYVMPSGSVENAQPAERIYSRKNISAGPGSIHRYIQGWIHPAGLFIALLGPDGAGKSTVIQHLVGATRTAFPDHKLFHWRPALLWRRKSSADVTNPHGRAPHSIWWSIVRVLSYVLDYWLAYFVKIRPAMVRSNLVVFDRYFYDLIVDPRRYRYGGPQWLISALMPLVPRPDLVFVLDASECIVLSRKQEVEPAEVRRQRNCYRRLAGKLRSAKLIEADEEIDVVAGKALQTIDQLLIRRSLPKALKN